MRVAAAEPQKPAVSLVPGFRARLWMVLPSLGGSHGVLQLG